MTKYQRETGVASIDAARNHQLDLGYSVRHDAQHGVQDLLEAAHCYIYATDDGWPFDLESFKRNEDRVDDLARAGAFVAAAIDLLLLARTEA